MRIDEIRALNDVEVLEQLREQEHGFMNLRFRHATLQQKDTSEIAKTRRTIARIRTTIRERQILKELADS